MIRPRRLVLVAVTSIAMLACSRRAEPDPGPPAWAYPMLAPDYARAPDDGTIRRVPDSTAGYTLSQVSDPFAAPDWHPGDHPPMPDIVARGRKPDVIACGYCHRADGSGGPENASLSGLSSDYIVQQLKDYRSGARSSALPQRLPQALMIKAAKNLSDDDMKAAAAYFSAIAPRASIRVIEVDAVPKTFVANWFLAPSPSGETESIGRRIVEVPDDVERFESRDARATFVAYVPKGSLARGERLVAGAEPRSAIACASCHGQDLRGLGVMPAIAGRSPTYLLRQLYELKTGVRAGAAAIPMKQAILGASLDDLIALAAYVASRPR